MEWGTERSTGGKAIGQVAGWTLNSLAYREYRTWASFAWGMEWETLM